ncbi:MAG: hypothetical protein ACOCRK_09275, partial [bacterium]
MSSNRPLDIYDDGKYNWNGLKIPIDKHEQEDLNKALNVGSVNIKCFIHTTCPFVDIQAEEQPLVFNDTTFSDVMSAGGANFLEGLTATPNMEGWFFEPRYSYRHNFLYHFPSNFNDEEDINSISNSDLREVDSDAGLSEDASYYNDGCREHQSWLVRESMYDKFMERTLNINIQGFAEIEEQYCIAKPVWTYSNERVESDSITEDLENDYVDEVWENDHIIDFNLKQCMKQNATSGCVGVPLHWRIQKIKELYRGEDFFIDFFKQEKKMYSTGDAKKHYDIDDHFSQPYI